MDYKVRIKDLPTHDRPRERLVEHGAAYLSTGELLAIILRTGSAKKSSVDLGKELLTHFGTLRGLGKASIDELCELKGIGVAKAVQIRAAFELSCRLSAYTEFDRPKVSCPADVYNFLKDDMTLLGHEELRVVILDTKNHILGIPIITVGILNSNLSHPRKTFRQAIQKNAAAIILVHNHPSGDPTPSQEDIALTKRYASAGEIIGIQVLDHVVIGAGRFISLREEGHIA
ncbi:MAG: hypothetical protein B6244_13520 [Candidatus Cloacimonetes bacterium 4572_55]|nr:MAG: hypothetical protein B6244_13520 [Candidatus Cloacimonetes bacterium 4572_55]